MLVRHALPAPFVSPFQHTGGGVRACAGRAGGKRGSRRQAGQQQHELIRSRGGAQTPLLPPPPPRPAARLGQRWGPAWLRARMHCRVRSAHACAQLAAGGREATGGRGLSQGGERYDCKVTLSNCAGGSPHWRLPRGLCSPYECVGALRVPLSVKGGWGCGGAQGGAQVAGGVGHPIPSARSLPPALPPPRRSLAQGGARPRMYVASTYVVGCHCVRAVVVGVS